MILNDKWDRRFLKLAEHVAGWSKDTTKVGAVIVNDDRVVVGMGYNGFSRGVQDLPERIEDRDLKLQLTIHAEENAIINATQSVKGCTIYVYPTLMIPATCPHCAAIVVQNGIKRLVQWHRVDLSERWMKLAEISTTILHEGGVQVDLLVPDKIYVVNPEK